MVERNDEVVFDSYLNLGFHHALLFPVLFAPWFTSMIDVEESRLSRTGLPGNELTPRDQVIAVRRAVSCRLGPSLRSQRTRRGKTMVERQHLSLPDWTAQWTIGPTAGSWRLPRPSGES